MSIQAPVHETVGAPDDTSAVEEAAVQSTTGRKPSLTYDGYPKPHLRGWIHACVAPLAVAASFDHSNIFLLIAGTDTPLSVALLSGGTAALVLGIVWGGAVLGIVKCLVWRSAPRWLSTVLYVALGWVAFWFLPQFWVTGGPAIVCLLLAGGVLYTVGGVIYVRQRPDPSPAWFGFHEIFHLCTVAGWACHCVACYLAVLG